MRTRQQIIKYLTSFNDAESDRICDRLQQCNVRVIRANGDIESNTTIHTHLQLIGALTNDPSIKDVEYMFNGKWTKV